MTERRPDDDPGLALSRALADDRFGSKAQRGDSTAYDGMAQVVLGVARGVRALVQRLRRR